MHTTTTAIIGGAGKTGRRVADRLRARGHDIRPLSRSTATRFDWEDRSTWAPALEGAGAAYVTYYPDVAVPGSAETVGALARVAVDAGVRRLVFLSGRGEAEAQRAERALQAAGAEATILRCNWFMQNFSESVFLEPVLSGEVALPAGDTPEPFVDADDIADVAVAALTEDGHAGEVYELSGPRALTFDEAVAEIARATGSDVRYVPISLDAFVAGAAKQGVPGELIDLLRFLFGEVLDGRNAAVTDGVQRALGRPPRDFRAFARRTAAAGVWTPAVSAPV